MADRSQLAYPGIITGKARVNFESLSVINPLNHVYFEFDTDDYYNARLIQTIPQNSILIGAIYCRVLESFDEATAPRLIIGTKDKLDVDDHGFGHTQIAVTGLQLLYTDAAAYYANILDENTDVYITIVTASTATLTKGKGWCVFSYLELNHVPSFRKLTGLEV